MKLPAPRDRPRRLSAPLAPVAIAMMLGVIVDRFLLPQTTATWASFAMAASLLAMARSVRSVALFAAFLAIGASWHHWRWSDLAPRDIAWSDASSPAPAWVRGAIVEPPQFHPSTWPDDPGRTISQMELAAISDGRVWHPVTGRILLVITGDRKDLQAGEPVFAAGSLAEILGPRNPGETDRRNRARAEGIRLRMSVGDPQGVWADPEGTPLIFDRWLGKARKTSYDLLVARLDPEIAGLAAALLLGRREGVDPDVNDAFARTGTTHLLAISGLHLQALAVLLFFAFRVVGMRRKPAFLGVMLATMAYAMLVGLMPSVVRSAAMTIMACLAGLCDRCSMSANRLSAAAIAMVAINPSHLFDAGCQLSFLAVMALFWGVSALVPEPVNRDPDDESTPAKRLDALERRLEGPVKKRVRRFARSLVRGLVASVVVWLATLPLVAYQFHIISPIGVLLNIPLIPITSLALLCAGLTLGLSAIWLPLATPTAWACGELLRATARIVAWGASRPEGWCFTPGPSFALMLGFYAILAWASWSTFRRWRSRRIAWGMLGAESAMMAAFVLSPASTLFTEAEVLAVDHGLAIVVQSREGGVMLYDCGKMRDPHVGRRIIAPALWSRGLRRIDRVILSHADSDHFNALPDLLDRFAIGEVRVPPGFGSTENPEASRLLDEIRAHGVPIREIVAGDRIDFGGTDSAEVLHPQRGWSPGAKDNARSVVLNFRSAGKQFLMTGDLEDAGLSEVAGADSPKPDVMLAPHHGGRTANPEWLYEWAGAQRVVVSQKPPQASARDPFAPLIAKEIPVDRTWQRGAVRVTFAEPALRVSGFLDETPGSLTPAAPVMAAIFPWGNRASLAILGLLLGLGICLAFAIIEWGAWSLVMPGRKREGRGPEPAPWTPIEVVARDGVRLRGAWLESQDAPDASPPAMILLHGFGEDRSGMVGRAKAMAARGWSVAVLDARGRGDSGGTRTAFGGYEADDLREWVTLLAGRTPAIVVWGRSMGAAIAFRAAAADVRIAFVILESPFADLREAVQAFLRKLKVPGVFADPMIARARMLAGVSLRHPTPIAVAKEYPTPVLILHGTEDSICPPAAVERLGLAIPEARMLKVEGAKHGDVFDRGGENLADQISSAALHDKASPVA